MEEKQVHPYARAKIKHLRLGIHINGQRHESCVALWL